MDNNISIGKAETNTNEKNCTLCKFFLSFRAEYEDPLEPWDFGTCNNDKSELEGNEGVGIEAACTCFTLK